LIGLTADRPGDHKDQACCQRPQFSRHHLLPLKIDNISLFLNIIMKAFPFNEASTKSLAGQFGTTNAHTQPRGSSKNPVNPLAGGKLARIQQIIFFEKCLAAEVVY
jgi:hypothetical protein